METSSRELWTLLHGLGFGGLYLLACSAALVELYRRYAPANQSPVTERDENFLRIYLVLMAIVAWITVLTGAYIIYPWYRAVPPPGTQDLSAFPQMILKSHPSTAGWHSFGMEWKEHVAWMTPISITMAAAVFTRYRRNLKNKPALRNAVLGFTLVSLVTAALAGFFGAVIDKHAPVQGGSTIRIMQGSEQ